MKKAWSFPVIFLASVKIVPTSAEAKQGNRLSMAASLGSKVASLSNSIAIPILLTCQVFKVLKEPLETCTDDHTLGKCHSALGSIFDGETGNPCCPKRCLIAWWPCQVVVFYLDGPDAASLTSALERNFQTCRARPDKIGTRFMLCWPCKVVIKTKIFSKGPYGCLMVRRFSISSVSQLLLSGDPGQIRHLLFPSEKLSMMCLSSTWECFKSSSPFSNTPII